MSSYSNKKKIISYFYDENRKAFKHKLILNKEQKEKLSNFLLLCLLKSFSRSENYFSDQLNSVLWNNLINFKKSSTYFDIRNSLVKNDSFRKFGLKAFQQEKLCLEVGTKRSL